MTLKADVDAFAADAALFHAVVHGSDTATVAVTGGTVSSMAKAVKDAAAPYASASASATAAGASAAAAANSAATAAAVVTGGTAAVGTGVGKIPLADGNGKITVSAPILSSGPSADSSLNGHGLQVNNTGYGSNQGLMKIVSNNSAEGLRFVRNTASAGDFSTSILLGVLTSTEFAGGVDNTQNLGTAAIGWKEAFVDNGTINTSDARRKTAVAGMSPAELNAAKQISKEIGTFKFLAAVAEKGDAARLHIGMTVQRAIEIMEANGLNPFAYSFICHDVWGDVFVDHPAVEAADAVLAVLDEAGSVIEPARPAVQAVAAWTEQTQAAGDKFSFRAHELLLFIAAGVEARLSALESV